MSDTRWNSAKLIAFSLFPVFPVLAPVGFYLGAPWIGAAVIFVVLPLLDLFLKQDRSGPFGQNSRVTMAWLYAIPQLYVIVWAAVLLWAVWLLSTGTLAAATAAGLIFSIGLSSAFATCAAHELLHWPEPLPRALARFVMAVVAYGHFPIEHMHHHTTVGIPHEGTTPPLGQSVWTFLMRNVAFSLRSARDIELQRQARKGLSAARNRFIQQWVLTAAIATAFVAAAGVLGLVLYLVQAALGVYTTEYVNYAQHYGLARKPDAPVTGGVSWSSNGFGTNAITLNITRHAHHHIRGGLRYYELEHVDGAPMLPAGYLALFFPAMVPVLWRRIMDARARPYSDASTPRVEAGQS